MQQAWVCYGEPRQIRLQQVNLFDGLTYGNQDGLYGPRNPEVPETSIVQLRKGGLRRARRPARVLGGVAGLQRGAAVRRERGQRRPERSIFRGILSILRRPHRARRAGCRCR